MRKTLLFSLLAIGCWSAIVSQQAAQGATRITEDLSAGWQFLRKDAAGAESPDYQEGSPWQNLNLPHTWNAKDTFDDEPGYYRGIGWYRKEFAVPEMWRGKRIVLRFEAACSVATAWVNGELLGQHKGSWTPFEFDITRLVKLGSGRNLVAVRVDNRWRRDVPPHEMDFNIMGGLHRKVFLIATDPLHIVSTRVTTPQVSDAEGVAAFEIEVRNDARKSKTFAVVTEIRGPELREPIVLTSRRPTCDSARACSSSSAQRADRQPEVVVAGRAEPVPGFFSRPGGGPPGGRRGKPAGVSLVSL